MSDLGSIAMLGGATKSTVTGRAIPTATWDGDYLRTMGTVVGTPAVRLQSFTAGIQRFAWGGEDLSVGNPAAPSLRMDAKGIWRFRWTVTVGSHAISVNVLHAINLSPRPSLCIKANPAIGIANDIETFAPSGTDWVVISSPSFTVTALGVVWVELRNNLETHVGFYPCYFDHIVKS